MQKVNKNGQFLEFRGISFVSMIEDSDMEDWKSLYDFMDTLKIFRKYYAIMPPSSYHFTVKNHIVIENESTWLDYTMENNIQNIKDLQNTCKRYNYTPTAVLKDFYMRGSVGIYVEPSQKNKLEKLRSDLTALGSFKEPNFKYHVNLGYLYKKIDKKDEESLKKDKKKIFSFINEKFKKREYKFNFKTAVMCYFPSMIKFVPLHNPVKTERCCVKYKYKGEEFLMALYDSSSFENLTFSFENFSFFIGDEQMYSEDSIKGIKDKVKDITNFSIIKNEYNGDSQILPELIWTEKY